MSFYIANSASVLRLGDGLHGIKHGRIKRPATTPVFFFREILLEGISEETNRTR
jgi:hypothetical protein